MSTPSNLAPSLLHGEADNDELGSFRVFMLHSDSLYDEVERAGALLNSRAIGLSQATASSSGEAVTAKFVAMFENELLRVTNYIQAQQESQEMSAKAFLLNIDTIVKKGTDPVKTSKSLRLKAKDLIQACIKLNRFTSSNQDALTNIAGYADKTLATSCGVMLQRRFSASPWKGPNSALVVVVSDIYEVIRSIEKDKSNRNGKDKWEAPSSFERSTTKYWVETDRLTDLLLTAVKEVPLLVYGKSGRLTSAEECNRSEGDKLWDSLATPISSVYFDSPSNSMYKERIARREGAQLLRVRWYGARPQGKGILFLELKTHHEKWINSKSVKERVNIREKDMSKFLASKPWIREDAEMIVLAASPDLSCEPLSKATDLLMTMHQLVLDKDLRPCVRSVYNRAAFQSPSSNDLRLTIDRNITLIDERGTNRGEWCLPDDAIIEQSMVSRVPYPVFEVKLAGSEMPASITDLLAKGVICEAAKFSKFLTGAAAFNRDKIETLPYWASVPSFAEMFSVPVKPVRFEKPKTLTQQPQQRQGSSSLVVRPDGPKEIEIISTSSTEELTVDDSFLQKSATAQTANKASELFQLFRRRKDKAPTIAPKKPVRVEPKSYFANERTYIQWISAALLLVTVSAILIERESDSGDGFLSRTGVLLSFGALLVVAYSTFVYFRRLKMLSTGSPYGYIDHVGPIFLALAVMCGVSVLLSHEIKTGTTTATLPVLRSQSGVCYQHSNLGISQMLYQPGDIAIDHERDMLLVPSLQRIIGHSISGSDRDVVTLAKIPNEDIEGLTIVGDRIFALSEDDDGKCSLIELEWQDDESLNVLQRWEVKTTAAQTEAIAYVPNEDGDDSLFVTASGTVKVFEVPSTAAAADDMTPPSPQVLQSRGTIDSKLLLDGLPDGGKIGAMYYFEDILYVLHDNDRVIRAWNMEAAELVTEIALPRVGGNFDKQWEGFAIERNDGSQTLGSGLKGGGPSSPLIVHLALDTPAQVWSFAVEEGSAHGSFTFPSCAAAV